MALYTYDVPPCEAETIQQLYEGADVDDEVMLRKERIEFKLLGILFLRFLLAIHRSVIGRFFGYNYMKDCG